MQRLQRYSSNELSHFVGRSQPSDEARYDLLLSVVRGGELLPPSLRDDRRRCATTEAASENSSENRRYSVSARLNKNPEAWLSSNERYLPSVVCFCDIPAEDLYIHTTKYGRFGLAFTKTFLARQGASPVFYVPRGALAPNALSARADCTRADVFDSEEMQSDITTNAVAVKHRDLDPGELVRVVRRTRRTDVEFWWSQHRRFLQFEVFAFMKFFDLDTSDEDFDNFYLEREWRVVGRVKFSLQNIETVFIPREYAARWRRDVPEFVGQVIFL